MIYNNTCLMAISPGYIGEQLVQGVSKFGGVALCGTASSNNVNVQGSWECLFIQSKVVANNALNRVPGDRRSDAPGNCNTEPSVRFRTISQHGDKILMMNRLAAVF